MGSVPTNAVQSVLSRFVSRVAGTLVAADHIDTLAIPAQPVTQLTFIDICEKKVAIIKFSHSINKNNPHV